MINTPITMLINSVVKNRFSIYRPLHAALTNSQGSGKVRRRCDQPPHSRDAVNVS
jgi:hypothetical protein